MPFPKKLCTLALTAALLPGCGGSDSDDDNTSTNNNDSGGGGTTETTTFSVSVDDGKQSSGSVAAVDRGLLDQMKSFFSSSAIAEPVPQLDKSQFDVVIINGDDNGTPSDASDDKDLVLDPAKFTVNPLGNGEYQISVPGRPRVDCYIATDLDNNGQLDLRVPTVNEDLNLDPVSEYVTRQVEQNAANFTNFDVSEIEGILDEVQRQVDNNPDLRDAIASASDYDAAVQALDSAVGNIVDSEFDTASAPATADSTVANVTGNHIWLGRSLGLEAAAPADGPINTMIADAEAFQAPAAASVNADGDVELGFTGTEDRRTQQLDFIGGAPVFSTDTSQDDLSGESVTLNVTALGLRLDEPTSTETASDGSTSTDYARSVNFTDVTGEMRGFLAMGTERYDEDRVTDSGTIEIRGFSEKLWVLAEERTSFDKSGLAGEWGLVAHSAGVSYNTEGYGAVSHSVEASPLTISGSGVVNGSTSNSFFEYGYETPIDGSKLWLDPDYSFDSKADTDSDTQLSFNSDGTFSAPTTGSTRSRGLVFPGNDMLVEVASDEENVSTAEQTGDGSVSVLLAVRRGSKSAAETKSLLANNEFRLYGNLNYNDPGAIKLEPITAGSLAFDANGDNAALSGFAQEFHLDLSPLQWRARSGTFSVDGIPVNVTSEGLIEIEQVSQTQQYGENRFELNGFVSADGENIILVVASRDPDVDNNGEIRGSLGILYGRCTTCN